jgi:hypothetical protein
MATKKPIKPLTVEAYLASLSSEIRPTIEAFRKVLTSNLDPGFEEGLQYGMLAYFVPHRLYPPGYHPNPKEPLPFVSLAAQKNHFSLYLMGLYVGARDEHGETEESKWLRAAWAKTGKKLDLGKSCLRFKALGDVPLEVLAQSIKRISLSKYVARYEAEKKMSSKK